MLTTQEIKALEDNSEKKGVSKLMLMENAGREVARVLNEKKKIEGKRILIICYHGNNGGDGFVAARYLADKAEVDVLFLGKEENLKTEGKENFHKMMDNPLIQFVSMEFVNFDDYDIIIDSMLGTGVSGEIVPPIATVIDSVNKTKAFKLSVDIPTGLNPDTGKVGDKVIDADLIVTFHDLKKGLKDIKDRCIVVDIGIRE